MCAPTTTALLLAALAALPCRGTNTDIVPKILPTPKELPKGTLFLNEDYQMLFTDNPEHNQNNLEAYHNNFTVYTKDNTALIANIKKSSNNQIRSCCNDSEDVNTNLNKGTNVDKDEVGNKKINRKRRVVKIQVDSGKIEAATVGITTVVAEVTIRPLVLERRRKPGETGSSAPLLNYIFDTYSNTHQHKNERSNPGNGIYAVASSEIEALVGSTAYLDCKVNALQDKFVSWVRRKNLEEAMELLTTGTQQYTSDERYSARFIPPDIWRLEVRNVRPSDAAFYDCQLPAHPPRTARVTLRVPEVSVRIVDGAGADISEQVCEVGSTVALRCEVQGLKMEGGPSLLWYRKNYLLNDDTTRGGISVRTEFGPNGANSVLRVARVRSDDAGQYTCTVARAPPPAPPPSHVMLHIIKGESLAELHQGAAAELSRAYLAIWIIIAMFAHIIVL